MNNPIRRFEILVLAPLVGILVILAVPFALYGRWWWLALCATGIAYLGLVTLNFHTGRSLSAILSGPHGASTREESLTQLTEDRLGRACGGAATVVGALFTFVAWGFFGLSWYFALPAGWGVIFWMGAMLKVAFTGEQRPG